MTERLMIDIDLLKDKYFCRLSNKQDGGGAMPFDMDRVSAGGDNKATGKSIFEELCKNSDIEKAIKRVLDSKQTQMIYFNPGVIPAQGVRWEAVWSDPGFVTLDRRWPIARIAGTDMDRAPVGFTPPLRIFAVISAEGIPGGPEWSALFDAADAAVIAGLPVEIRVVTGQQDLFNSLNPPTRPWVTVAPVPETADELSIQIGTFNPHILHFFCHGLTDAGNAHLLMERNNGTNLDILIRDVTQISGLEDVWLVVLNSCLGAVAQDGYLSMAHRIVSDGNVPYAIGSTEKVDVTDAHTFSRAFYNRLLFEFGQSVRTTAVNKVLTLSWGDALYAARDAINKANGGAPEAKHQWILPILYEHRSRLQLIKQDAPTTVPLRAKMAMDLLAKLPPETDEATKKLLVEAMLNQPN